MLMTDRKLRTKNCIHSMYFSVNWSFIRYEYYTLYPIHDIFETVICDFYSAKESHIVCSLTYYVALKHKIKMRLYLCSSRLLVMLETIWITNFISSSSSYYSFDHFEDYCEINFGIKPNTNALRNIKSNRFNFIFFFYIQDSNQLACIFAKLVLRL